MADASSAGLEVRKNAGDNAGAILTFSQLKRCTFFSNQGS